MSRIQPFMSTDRHKVNFTRYRVAFAAFMCAVLAPFPARAELDVRPLDCGSGVRVRIDGVPVLDAVSALSSALKFQFAGPATEKGLVRLHGTFRPQEIMRQLAQQANLIVQFEPDGQCVGDLRIRRVWILTSGLPSTPAAVPTASPAVAAPPDPAVVMYLRAHGHAIPETTPAN